MNDSVWAALAIKNPKFINQIRARQNVMTIPIIIPTYIEKTFLKN
jgi:hypothetical protein